MDDTVDIESLFSQKGIVESHPPVKRIMDRLENKEGETIDLFYGETYDEYGHPIDSMKYYFFVSDLADSLEEEGADVNPRICVSDTAQCRNVSDALEDNYMKLGEERAKFVEEVNKIYDTNLKVVKMSDFIDREDFKNKAEKVKDICQDNEKLMNMVEETVPPSKLEEERERGFEYSFDEITTILDLDIKVGPPREHLYDSIARKISDNFDTKGPMSVFLTPTYPLGKKWSYFFAHENIEEYGITAYKGGSKRLQDYRILVGETSTKEVSELVKNSFLSENQDLPNPVLDAGNIALMAKKEIEKNDEPIRLYENFYDGKISKEDLREKTIKNLNEYIISKF